MILHVDMDAFYASIEQRERPELLGTPVIVGGSPQGRGVVSAASYEARKFGIHSAMPTSRAIRLCPHATIIRPRMAFYIDVSRQIHEIFNRYTPEIEPLSLDEAFLDVRGSAQLFGSATRIGKRIKGEIRNELRLVASVGVAPNKFLAKLASDLEKPDGFTVITNETLEDILCPLPISRMWGVGRVTQRKFESLHISTFGHLRQLTMEQACELFGKTGEHFWRLAQGMDDRPVVSYRQAKTISHESTFPVDITDMDVLLARMLELTEQVAARVRRHRLQGRTIHIKVRYSDFDTITRSRSLDVPTNATDKLWQIASQMLLGDLPSRPLEIRLLGIGVSNLEESRPTQLNLFEGNEALTHAKLDAATDSVRNIFGKHAPRRASTLPTDKLKKR